MDEESGPKILVQIVSEIPYALYAISWLLVARMRVTLRDKWDMRHVTTGRQTEHFNCLVKYFGHAVQQFPFIIVPRSCSLVVRTLLYVRLAPLPPPTYLLPFFRPCDSRLLLYVTVCPVR